VADKRVPPEVWLQLAAMAPPIHEQTLLSAMEPGQSLESVQALHAASFADRLARLFLDRYPEMQGSR
jgi:hypothetical protein